MSERPPPSPPPSPRSFAIVWLAVFAAVALGVFLGLRSGIVNVGNLSRNDLGQLGYLIIVLLFVGSALLGRGLGAGEVLRSTAAWLAILLVLAGAYAYRDELAVVGGRLMAALAPGVPISGRMAGDTQGGSVVIDRSFDGHFGILANVDGVPLTLMVDTGASFVTLTQSDAERIGIALAGLAYSMPIRTANGVIRAAPVKIDRIAIGPIVREHVAGLVAPDASLDQSLLGMSFLDTLGGYAIAGDRMVLKP
jgi:aspartyl protease family protein